MINFAITTDLEVLGTREMGYDHNSDHNIYEQMIRNSVVLLDLADKYNIKVSFMLEVIEYERFHEGHNPEVQELDDLIKRAFISGHDVQIHGHPDWVFVVYGNNKWYLKEKYNCDRVRIIHNVINKFFKFYDRAVNRLRFLLGEDWEPLVFRAGGYRIDPTVLLFNQLKSRGIIADTSKHSLIYGSYWVENGLVELPIYGEYPTQDNRWDLNLGGRSYNKCFEGIPKDAIKGYFPLVMMGHTKMNHNFVEIEKLFKQLTIDDRFVSNKISDIARKLLVQKNDGMPHDKECEKLYKKSDDPWKCKNLDSLRWFITEQWRQIFMSTILDRYKVVVEAGCGFGRLVEMIATKLDKQAIGLDTSDVAIKGAMEMYPDREFIVGDIRTWAPNFKVDMVLVPFIYRLPRGERIRLYQHVYSYLSPGGALFVLESPSDSVDNISEEIFSIFKKQKILSVNIVDNINSLDERNIVYIGEK